MVTYFDRVGMETIYLPQTVPLTLSIRIENAIMKLDKLEYVTTMSSGNSRKSSNIRSVQTADIVDKLNQHLEQRNGTWRAGITSMSEMTYEQKKVMFGGNVPNLGGYEYYRDGIFVMPDYEPGISILKSSLYVEEFDWRNRHGKNWLTSAKLQTAYTCWTFGALGIVEAYANLYYNRLLNYDLSEQELISCINPGYDPYKSGGFVSNALTYVKNHGVVEESCFPFKVLDDCSNKCSNPNEVINIDNFRSLYSVQEDDLKANLLKAPICLDVFLKDWGHSVVLAGYKKIKEGDRIQIHMPQEQWIEIEPGNPLIGSTAWLIRNSMGNDWGNEGYAYIVTGWTDYMRACAISGKVHSLIYTESNIVCEDNDEDGYYFWGIGDKPASLPSWIPDDPDGNDSNADVGPMNSYGYLKDLNPDLLSSQIVNTVVLWSGDNYIHTHLFLEDGGELTLSGIILMYKDAKIVVKSGGTLIVDSGKIIRANIIVESGGHLIVRNGGVIEKGQGDELDIRLGATIEISEGNIDNTNK